MKYTDLLRTLAVTAILLLGVSIDTLAGINNWSAIGPNGGYINKIAFSAAPNTVFLAAAGGFYRSQDGGATWQLISSNFMNSPGDLAVDPSDATRIYVVAPNPPSLYVSTDGGSTIAPAVNLPTQVTQAQRIAVSQDGMTIYVASGPRLFYSTNRGQSWLEGTPLSNDSTGQAIKLLIDPTDPKTLYAAIAVGSTGAEGILATHDGAMTWQQLTSGTESASLTSDLAINPANPSQIWSAQFDGIWVSPDRGAHWSNVFGSAMVAIAIDPTNPSVLYAGTAFGLVYRSANAGVNWTDVSGNISAGQNLHIVINPAQTTQLLVGGFSGVSATTTSGVTWSSQQSGINSTTVSGFSADPGSDRIYLNVPTGGLFYTANGAGTTAPVNNAALLQLSMQPSFLITSMLAQPGRLSASLINGLARSADAGATWSPLVQVVPPGIGSQQLAALASSPGAPQTILAASSTGLYRTIDGGDLWTQVVSGVPSSSAVGQVLFAPSDPTIAYASVYASGSNTFLGIYGSTDAGNSWTLVNGTPTSATSLIQVDAANAMTVYGFATSGLLKSGNGGSTWSSINWDNVQAQGAPFRLAVDPVNSNILYAAGVGRIARSVDGGCSWETLRDANALPFWSPNALIADPNRPENLLVATANSGVQQLTVAPDLALTLVAPANPLAVGVAASYAFTVSNLGPFDSTGVSVTAQLPSTAQNITASMNGGTCTVATLVVTCNLAILRKGASAALTVSTAAATAGSFPVSANVRGDQPDADPTNNAVTSAGTASILADLSVTATGNAAAHVGDALVYTLTVANAGPNTAPAPQLTYLLAAGLTPGTATSAGATCSAVGQQITCNLNDLAAKQSATITVNATAAAVGTQTSAASVSSAAVDTVSANNSASSSTTVSAVPVAQSGHSGGGSLSLYEELVLGLLSLASQLKRAGPQARLRNL